MNLSVAIQKEIQNEFLKQLCDKYKIENNIFTEYDSDEYDSEEIPPNVECGRMKKRVKYNANSKVFFQGKGVLKSGNPKKTSEIIEELCEDGAIYETLHRNSYNKISRAAHTTTRRLEGSHGKPNAAEDDTYKLKLLTGFVKRYNLGSIANCVHLALFEKEILFKYNSEFPKGLQRLLNTVQWKDLASNDGKLNVYVAGWLLEHREEFVSIIYPAMQTFLDKTVGLYGARLNIERIECDEIRQAYEEANW